MSKKFTHGDVIEIHSSYVEGDIVKFEYKNREVVIPKYSKIIKVIPRLNDKKEIYLSYVMEDGTNVNHVDIKEIIKKTLQR